MLDPTDGFGCAKSFNKLPRLATLHTLTQIVAGGIKPYAIYVLQETTLHLVSLKLCPIYLFSTDFILCPFMITYHR